MKRGLLFIFVLTALLLGTGGLGYFQFVVKPQMIKKIISSAAPPPATVAVVQAQTATWEPRLTAIGSFRAYQGIDVSPELGGIIRRIEIESGQDVEKGALLFEIDTSVERADLKSNQATLKNANLVFERQNQLTLSGNTAKANVDSAEAARNQAAAAVEKVQATIAQKTITAPFAGRLGIRKADLGQYVSPGTSLITLQRLDPIFVDFPVPEKSLGIIGKGQTIAIRVDAYPDQVFSGVIKTIDARIDLDSRNVLVRGEVDNKGLQLLPGMFANVTVEAGTPVQAVTLPRTAITYSLYGDSVFVVKASESNNKDSSGGAQAAANYSSFFEKGAELKIERRFVRAGETRGDLVSILDGIQPGEIVVSQGQVKLHPNMLVQIDPGSVLVSPKILPRE